MIKMNQNVHFYLLHTYQEQKDYWNYKHNKQSNFYLFWNSYKNYTVYTYKS